MATVNSINLFQSKSSRPAEFEKIEKYLLYIRYGILGCVVLAGSISGLLYFLFRGRVADLKSQKQEAIAYIEQNVVKEGRLTALHKEIERVGKIIKTQHPWVALIDTTLAIAKPPVLTHMSISGQETVQITVKVSEIPDALTVIHHMKDYLDMKKIRDPVITSLTLDKEGFFVIGFSYDVIM